MKWSTRIENGLKLIEESGSSFTDHYKVFGNKNQYRCFADGRIYRVTANKTSEIKQHKKVSDYRGGAYLVVSLNLDGKHKTYYVHRIVATLWIENPFNKPQVNHIDGNRFNNHVTNLEWVTAQENMDNAGDREAMIGRSLLDGKCSEVKILQAIEMINTGKRNNEIAKFLNVNPSVVSKLRYRKGNAFRQFHSLVKIDH